MSEPSGALSNQGDVDVKDGCLFTSEEMARWKRKSYLQECKKYRMGTIVVSVCNPTHCMFTKHDTQMQTLLYVSLQEKWLFKSLEQSVC